MDAAIERVATYPDTPRPVAAGGDLDYTLSIEEVSEMYAKAGHARTIRTLQRYCVSGHLEAQKVATRLGDKFLVTPQSVARHIAQIRELSSLDNDATRRDQPRPVATAVAAQPAAGTQVPHRATYSDDHRQTATAENDASRYVARLEKEVEQAKGEQPASADTLQRLAHSAVRWYGGEGTAQEGAMKYYTMNMVEKRVMEMFFPSSIFVTFNGSEHRDLFPDNLPIFYMYSLRRGTSVKPWFLPDPAHGAAPA